MPSNYIFDPHMNPDRSQCLAACSMIEPMLQPLQPARAMISTLATAVPGALPQQYLGGKHDLARGRINAEQLSYY